jgi:hypothetical protein
MGNGRDKDMILSYPIEDGVRESIEYKPSLTTLADRISQRSFQYSADCVIDF